MIVMKYLRPFIFRTFAQAAKYSFAVGACRWHAPTGARSQAKVLIFIASLLLLAACDQQTVTPTPVVGPTQTPAITATPDTTPGLTPGPMQSITDTMSVELERMLSAKISPTPAEPTGDPHIVGVHAFKLQGGDQPLWVAHTYGSRSFDPQENHSVSIYAHANEKWQELSRLELDTLDYVDPASVAQVQIDAKDKWLQVEAGVGAHGGAFYILRFDGDALHKEIEFTNSTPNVGEVRDVNGDGAPDVVLNESDAYIFCYACNVRLLNFGVMRWDGAKTAMVRVELEHMNSLLKGEDSRLNDLAIQQADAGLWKAAKENIMKARALSPQDATLAWNDGLIGITADARQAHIAESGHPLLETVFYGDYDAAIASIRRYSPEELFGSQTPLIAGTPAEGGNEETLRTQIKDTTTKALVVDPNLAGALFLRGWAEFQAGDKAQATDDITRAAQLEPKEELFKKAAAYLANK